MIKTVLAQGDTDYLIKLLDSYSSLNDEKEILKVSGKIIQKANKMQREKLIELFDHVYMIISKDRKIFRNIIDLEITDIKKGMNIHE